MNRVSCLTTFFAVSFCFVAVVSARQPLPADMAGAADMRSKIGQQLESAAASSSAITGGGIPVNMEPAATPEKEMERRRKLINEAHRNYVNMKGDARADIGSEGIATASASSRDVPLPPRAIPIEGRVVIEGHQADARAPRDQGAGAVYSVEERFVGNLIIAEAEPVSKSDIADAVASGKIRSDEGAPASSVGTSGVDRASSGSLRDSGKALVEEYQIDTVSTGVKVLSLGGGACIKSDGGRDSECVEKDPFIKSEVSQDNKYGNFHDDVIAAQSANGKVKIEVAVPEVSFVTNSGGSTVKMDCGHAVFEMGVDDLKQLVDNGSATLTKRRSGAESATKSCRQGFTTTLHIKIKGK